MEPCTYRISVKAWITDEQGRFLLCRESNGHWDLPGGGLDHGEDPLAGVVREIYEELGVEADVLGDQPLCFCTCVNNHGWYLANVLYPVSLRSMDIEPSEECQEVQFFSLEEAKGLPTWANVQAVVAYMEQHRNL